MAVRIRLKRTGAINKPSYRIVVADVRCQRDGKFIENLGYYDPRHNDEKLDLERANYWISCGAQPSKPVEDILRRAKGEPSKPRKPIRPKKQTEEKVEKQAAASEAAPEAESAAK